MHFQYNHDENSGMAPIRTFGQWFIKRLPYNYDFDGIPLIYSGQEEPLTARLKFFLKKDTIHFNKFSNMDFYSTLPL